MRKTRLSIQLLIIGGLFLSCAIAGNAQTVDQEMCRDGTFHPPGFNCTTYLCGNGWAQSHGFGSLCGSPATAPNNINPALQGAANQIQNAISDAVANWLRGGDPNVRAAADAAAAEAAREQQAERDRQRLLEEQKRQAMFNRLRHELKMSGFGEMSLKGFDNSGDQMHLKGFGDSASNTGGVGMHLKGFGDNPSAGDNSPPNTSTPLGPQTCFFGECGPQDPGLQDPIDAWNDPKVVDLRDLQQSVDMAGVAAKAPPADRQAIMDQALDAANGDQTIQVTPPANSAVPVMSEQGLLAFQQANNVYRQAHDSAYQLQQSYQLNQQREAAATAIVTQTEKQLEADLRANIDQMTLEQKQLAMAQIFDAALQQDLAFGRTWAQYLAARQQFYRDRYELQMYLWNTALGKRGNPPPVPPQLTQPPTQKQDFAMLEQVQLPSATPTQTIPGPPDSDLNLVLPAGPTVAPSKEDLSFLQQVQSPDPITQQVLDSFRKDQAAMWSKQAALDCPPNIVNQFEHNPQFQQHMNAESKMIYAQQQQANQTALREAEAAWNQTLSDLQSKGVIQPGVPLAQQVQNNPQFAAQLASAQKQITAKLDYQVKRAEYEAQHQWQKWIEQQEAILPQAQISSVAAVRD